MSKNLNIITVVGARPQFIKASMLSRAILKYNSVSKDIKISESIIHTGQHYDQNMSNIFFEQLKIPRPAVMLECGAQSHGAMTAQMLVAIEKIILEKNPQVVVVYGDTNSTLAAALAASKLHVPVCHIEAGLRSFNKLMPEEINRILTDHVSELLLCPTSTAMKNLKAENITSGVYHTGDIMYDAAVTFGEIAEKESDILIKLNIQSGKYYLATVHRAENTDSKSSMENIVDAFIKLGSEKTPLVWPLHPRARKYLESYDLLSKIENHSGIYICEPVSFLDMILLEKNARTILTDSGGIQKEAFFHSTPCVTLREQTEWVETIDAGWNQLAGASKEKIINAVLNVSTGENITEYGTGKSAEKNFKFAAQICQLKKELKNGQKVKNSNCRDLVF